MTLSALDKVNVARASQTLHKSIETLVDVYGLDGTVPKEDLQKAVQATLEGFKEKKLINASTLTFDNYVSSSVCHFKHDKHKLDIVFQVSTKSHSFKMSWRRAKKKIAMLIYDLAQQIRYDIKLYSVVPVESIKMAFILEKNVVDPTSESEEV